MQTARRAVTTPVSAEERQQICGDRKYSWQPGLGVKGRSLFLVVDHDHETGRVRGLLCTRCNIGIGQFREGPAIMRAAIQYVGT